MFDKLSFRHKKIALTFFLIIGFFALLQIYLNYHTMISPDDFWFVHTVYQKYRVWVPYRDFSPYKSVIPYYFILLPVSFIKDPFYIFVWTHHFVTGINAILLFVCSLWLTRFYSYKAVLMSVLFLISTYFFINISNDIRLDMLAYWFSLMSALLLLEERYIKAGILLGIAFSVSQKTLWYLCASDFALFATWCLFVRSFSGLRNILIYNFSFLGVVSLYIGGWSLVGGFHSVINSFLYEAMIVFNIDIYNNGLVDFVFILLNDPFYLMLWLVAAFTIFITPRPSQQKQRFFVICYATMLLIFVLTYKQLFFYHLVSVVPALLLLYSDFFNWVDDLFKYENNRKTMQAPKLSVTLSEFVLLMIICELILVSVFVIVPIFNYIDLALWSLTFILGLFVYQIFRPYSPNQHLLVTLFYHTFYILFLSTLVLYGYEKMVPVPPQNGYLYQKQTIELVDDLTKDGSTYVAGVDLIFNKKQAMSGNSFLYQNILYLNSPNEHLKKMMLSSLDLDPNVTVKKLIDDMKEHPVKVYVHTFFMEKVPGLKVYLNANYEHLWGNVYIYAPEFISGKHNIDVKFMGDYKVESKFPLIINGKKIYPDTIIHLDNHRFEYVAADYFRLKLSPPLPTTISNKYFVDIVPRLFYECKFLNINGKKKCFYAS